MAEFNNAMEIFRFLPKTNCKECGETTCLAFAGAVFTGKTDLSCCPHVPDDKLQQYGTTKRVTNPIEEEFQAVMEKQQTRLLTLDFEERARIIKAEYNEGKITLPILGKLFSIDRYCNVTTDIHVNSWVLGTVLHYLNYSQGVPLSLNWVPLRELPSGKDWYRLFGQQCENVLKTTADTYPGLFSDLVEAFRGKMIDERFQSDVAVILAPLPLVPMLICYWYPEEGMESSLKLFFDATAEANLGIEGLYTLGVGIAQMLQRLTKVHGHGQ
ncbi:MAG: DUF3786 domain-containing protein [Desulfofustis sp.]|nr:DUF3786 domain-containing protein [Desulfofustis sp.]NNK57205.1 DUF3786 domain-containing protein [Desulfofustis sp.]